jgi:hypothetical protein
MSVSFGKRCLHVGDRHIPKQDARHRERAEQNRIEPEGHGLAVR